VLGAGLWATLAAADTSQFDTDLELLQQQWAVANYQLADPTEQKRALETISQQAHRLTADNPGRAEAMIWEGIVLSTYAGVKGGLGALGLAKQSRALFESALQVDPTALQGSAYTSLGVLYYKVPGFPLSFGNEEKARELLLKALAINPAGIDSNFFYAQFLCDRHRCTQALPYLEKAAKAPPRPGREIADRGRHREIAELTERAKKDSRRID
jgi:tetratricopeptide (TPR) repeat protein